MKKLSMWVVLSCLGLSGFGCGPKPAPPAAETPAETTTETPATPAPEGAGSTTK